MSLSTALLLRISCFLLALGSVHAHVAARSFDGTIRRSIHRTLHEGRPASTVKLRNLFARTRNVGLGRAPDARIVRASLAKSRGHTVLRLKPVGVAGARRVAGTSVHVHGQKWNFERKRWQSFHLRVVVQVMAARKVPHVRTTTRRVDRRVTLKVGRELREAVSKTLRVPVRKLATASGSRIVRARQAKGVPSIRALRPGKSVVMSSGEYLDRRAGKWKRFRLFVTVHVSR